MLVVIGTAIVLARFSWELLFARDVEAVLYDLRAAATAPRVEPDPRIVLIVYDDDTLSLTGKRSPLDRTVLAKALARIDAMGAKSIGIDVLIDQPQPEDPVLVTAFRAMKTPTWLAYASNATNGDKITFEQQRFLEKLYPGAEAGQGWPGEHSSRGRQRQCAPALAGRATGTSGPAAPCRGRHAARRENTRNQYRVAAAGGQRPRIIRNRFPSIALPATRFLPRPKPRH